AIESAVRCRPTLRVLPPNLSPSQTDDGVAQRQRRRAQLGQRPDWPLRGRRCDRRPEGGAHPNAEPDSVETYHRDERHWTYPVCRGRVHPWRTQGNDFAALERRSGVGRGRLPASAVLSERARLAESERLVALHAQPPAGMGEAIPN